ncbi:19931_t:CDS:2 [Cetraspora pellucida]|uniref:19931_t:CDS:1 n=1 Tax=Cetraspora pellucida TaxID=1433469 RepID=A0A9N9CI47_9GLOM|nr:19931_t:CDS:2 [Cetraspora pellucida]
MTPIMQILELTQRILTSRKILKQHLESFFHHFHKDKIVYKTDYDGNPDSANWVDVSEARGAYSISSGKLKAILHKPVGDQHRAKDEDGPYNKNLGKGLSMNSTYMMLYGTVSVEMKACGVGGVVTALCTMSKEGDEIDWETVGKDIKHAQTDFFYRGFHKTGVDGVFHSFPDGGTIDSDFHTYTINWGPKKIKWLIDGITVRTLERSSTFEDGIYKYPSKPSYITLSLWDGSGGNGTAQWSNGPINWKKSPNIPPGVKILQPKAGAKFNQGQHEIVVEFETDGIIQNFTSTQLNLGFVGIKQRFAANLIFPNNKNNTFKYTYTLLDSLTTYVSYACLILYTNNTGNADSAVSATFPIGQVNGNVIINNPSNAEYKVGANIFMYIHNQTTNDIVAFASNAFTVSDLSDNSNHSDN